MPRMARLVVPGYPHHVTQRGCRRQLTFFDDSDYQAYIALLASLKRHSGVEFLAYCLMPNHAHLVVVPSHEHSLARLFRTVHRRFALRVNAAHDWRGHLWQERFYSCVMDERHTLAAIRYVELNPVRAGLCAKAADWRWSSARAHLYRQSDALVSLAPVCEQIHDWDAYLAEHNAPEFDDRIRLHTRTGRPAGVDAFVEALEIVTGRRLKVQKSGPKSRN